MLSYFHINIVTVIGTVKQPTINQVNKWVTQ
jgi:hypothetical protein